jgi:hypothetical protein
LQEQRIAGVGFKIHTGFFILGFYKKESTASFQNRNYCFKR